MELYSKDKNYTLYHGNMLDLLDVIPPNSIDSIVCDPPYELNFMNKGWDNSGIAFDKNAWKKCFQVLKGGGYLLVFGGSRTYHRIACAIEDVGFEIRDCVMYLYGTGFPKSMDVGLAIDKKNGIDNRTGNIIKGCANQQICYDLNLKKEYEERIAQNEWQGWGTALKPAYEPIIVARKPFKGSLVNNIIKNGVGALNIDECRVGNEERTQYSGKSTNGTVYFNYPQNNAHFETVVGRFPANVITDGSEEVQSGFPETKSNGGNCRMKGFSQFKGSMMSFTNQKQESQKSRIVSDKKLPIDSGNACRYFYCAKASTKDREEGLDTFEKSRTTDGCIRTNEETARKFGAVSGLRKNIHPTVKPTALMQYLVRLVSPKGSVILDPFMGSGSTGKAVMFENNERNANYKFIGIELTKEYLPICEARIKWASEQNTIVIENTKENKVEKYQQTTLFDFLE